MGYTKRDRIMAIAAGEAADRPPVSAWHHFLDVESNPEAFINASVEFQKKFDWDMVKIHPRAIYFAEAMGNRYDYTNYTGPMPKCVHSVIESAADLWNITRLPGDEGVLSEQLNVITRMRKILGAEVPMIQTLFSPLAVFIHMAGAKNIGRNKPANSEENPAICYLRNHPEGAHIALNAITNTMADYVQRALKAGADGFFYTPLGLAREGYLTLDEWNVFGRSYDLQVLEAASNGFNVLHTCGMYGNPKRFADYPIAVLHWAQSAPGNPAMVGSESWLGKMGVMGGIDECYFGANKPQSITLQVAESCRQMQGRPFFLAPECSVTPATPDVDLMLLRQAAEQC